MVSGTGLIARIVLLGVNADFVVDQLIFFVRVDKLVAEPARIFISLFCHIAIEIETKRLNRLSKIFFLILNFRESLIRVCVCLLTRSTSFRLVNQKATLPTSRVLY